MYTLFIDTHFKDVKLGLYRDEKLLKISEATEFSSTSQTVLPMIRSILKVSHFQVHVFQNVQVPEVFIHMFQFDHEVFRLSLSSFCLCTCTTDQCARGLFFNMKRKKGAE